MEIEVDLIKKIVPCLASRGGMSTAVMVDVWLQDFQAEQLFYKLWEHYGDDFFKQWIEAENYTFVKRTTKQSGAVDNEPTTATVTP
jgi:hypothetical protein